MYIRKNREGAVVKAMVTDEKEFQNLADLPIFSRWRASWGIKFDRFFTKLRETISGYTQIMKYKKKYVR